VGFAFKWDLNLVVFGESLGFALVDARLMKVFPRAISRDRCPDWLTGTPLLPRVSHLSRACMSNKLQLLLRPQSERVQREVVARTAHLPEIDMRSIPGNHGVILSARDCSG
jgi:hypothetical protein